MSSVIWTQCLQWSVDSFYWGQASQCPFPQCSILHRKPWIDWSHQMEKDTGILGIWQSRGRRKGRYLEVFGYLVDRRAVDKEDESENNRVCIFRVACLWGGRRVRQSVFVIKGEFSMEKTDERFLSDDSWQLRSEMRGSECLCVHICVYTVWACAGARRACPFMCCFCSENGTWLICSQEPPAQPQTCAMITSVQLKVKVTKIAQTVLIYRQNIQQSESFNCWAVIHFCGLIAGYLKRFCSALLRRHTSNPLCPFSSWFSSWVLDVNSSVIHWIAAICHCHIYCLLTWLWLRFAGQIRAIWSMMAASPVHLDRVLWTSSESKV